MLRPKQKQRDSVVVSIGAKESGQDRASITGSVRWLVQPNEDERRNGYDAAKLDAHLRRSTATDVEYRREIAIRCFDRFNTLQRDMAHLDASEPDDANQIRALSLEIDEAKADLLLARSALERAEAA